MRVEKHDRKVAETIRTQEMCTKAPIHHLQASDHMPDVHGPVANVLSYIAMVPGCASAISNNVRIRAVPRAEWRTWNATS